MVHNQIIETHTMKIIQASLLIMNTGSLVLQLTNHTLSINIADRARDRTKLMIAIAGSNRGCYEAVFYKVVVLFIVTYSASVSLIQVNCQKL